MPTVHLLDYVAGNIRSLVNAIEKLGYQVDWITSPEDVPKAEVRSLLPSSHVNSPTDPLVILHPVSLSLASLSFSHASHNDLNLG